MVRLFAQNLHAQRVERANRQPARLRFGQHFGDALLHFRSGFVGKGNRGNGMRQIADIDNQMFDFLRNHAGFTAAGAGKHEQRPAEVFDGGLLLGVEFHGNADEPKRGADYNRSSESSKRQSSIYNKIIFATNKPFFPFFRRPR